MMTVTQDLVARQARSDRIRESIVAAATACLADGGFGSDRLMSAVAREAGVSRPTVYRYFPAWADLRDTVVQRELAILVETVLPMIEQLTWTEDAVVELLAYVVGYARGHRLFGAALRDAPEQVLPLFTVDAATVIDAARAALQPSLQERIDAGAIPQCEAGRLVDVLARLALSLTFTNSSVNADDPAIRRRYLHDLFGLMQLLG